MADDRPCVLVVHSSRFGQSTKIAQAIADELGVKGYDTDVQALSSTTAPDPQRHAGLVLVASVRYGFFAADAYKMIDRYRAWLESVPTLLVTVSLTARTEAKRDPAVHSYTVKFLAKSGWKPSHTEVVAGILEYPRYRIWDRLAIQLIMNMTHGPTDPHVTIEYTDWDRVKATADEYAVLLKEGNPS